ncbi:MAG: hypothetical protein PHC33_04870 [Candidatus Omnitrophica bacterium]|nr:hypothetical protein [Candidatus Omnitrophota bacterium]
MNRAVFFILCGVFAAGCSEPPARRTFSENDLMPPESRQTAGAHFPDGRSIAQPAVPQTADVQVEVKEEPEASRKNPFLRESEESLFESTKDRLPITGLNLSAIFYSPGTSAAIIDGKFFKEGDIVDNKRIITISPEEVILKDAQSVYVLQLKGILN